MAKLIYTAISSLDGYVADSDGNFDWSAPDEDVHRFVNDLERSNGTYLLGRRMYEVMRYWESAPTGNGELSAERTTRGSGKLPTRSSTPPACSRYPVPGPASSESSIRKRSGI